MILFFRVVRFFSGCPMATSNCVSWFSLGVGISAVEVNEGALAMVVSPVFHRDVGVMMCGTLVGVCRIFVIMSCACGFAVSGGADMSRIPVSVYSSQNTQSLSCVRCM